MFEESQMDKSGARQINEDKISVGETKLGRDSPLSQTYIKKLRKWKMR